MGFIGSMLGINTGAGFQASGGGLSSQMLGGANNAVGGAQQSIANATGDLLRQGGVQNQQNIFAQQQGLANQLQDQSLGNGPNPALAQLALTTGQNTANQAALMAGQRGVQNNPALMAQLIAQNGASQQQQAVGQAAQLRAQQQLAAQQNLMQQQSNMAGLAGAQVGQSLQGLGALQQGALQNQQTLAGLQQNINSANAGVASTNAQTQGQMGSGIIGGGLGALGKAGTALFGLAHGGMVGSDEPQSYVGKHLKMSSGGPVYKGGGKVPGKANVPGDSEKNDKVKALLSPGEVVIPRSKVGNQDKTADFINAVLGMNLRSSNAKKQS